jgi:co-chaperonin GroES (HSP10)
MKNQKIIPIGKKILILEKKPEQFFPGTTIIIPDSAKEKTYQGYVVGVGKEISDINVGDLVQYVDYANAQEMHHNGEKHLLISHNDILAVIVGE